MKIRTIVSWSLFFVIAACWGTMEAGADDPKKPAAVSASKPATSSGTTAKPKPAAVQASSGKEKATIATHIEVVDASVKLVKRYDSSGNEYKAATNISDVQLVVKGHGIQTEFAGTSQKSPNDPVNYDGQTAFQILVEQGYFEFKDGIGFIPTKKYAQIRDISSGSGNSQGSSNQGGSPGQGKGTSFLDAAKDLKLTTTNDEKLVAPQKTESVAEDPSQQGGLFGYTIDDNWETYNPDDPNTPEGKRKLLKTQLSELSGLCWDTPEATEYLGCNEACNDLLWSEYGKVSSDKVEECRRNCKNGFQHNKPQVCRDADAVEAQLDQLGDD